jgi:hypothetical protein
MNWLKPPPFEGALPYRTENNVAENMVRDRFVREVAAEWRRRGAAYAALGR